MSSLRIVKSTLRFAAPRLRLALAIATQVRGYNNPKPIDYFDDTGKPVKTMPKFVRDKATYCQQDAERRQKIADSVAAYRLEHFLAREKVEKAMEAKKAAREEIRKKEEVELQKWTKEDEKYIGAEHLGEFENWIPDASRQGTS